MLILGYAYRFLSNFVFLALVYRIPPPKAVLFEGREGCRS